MRKKGNTVLAGLIICLLLVFLAAAGKLFGAYGKCGCVMKFYT